jgi:hypothetical protein
MADFIEFARGDAGSHIRGNHIKHTGCQTACVTHFGKAFLAMLNYRFGTHAFITPDCHNAIENLSMLLNPFYDDAKPEIAFASMVAISIRL